MSQKFKVGDVVRNKCPQVFKDPKHAGGPITSISPCGQFYRLNGCDSGFYAEQLELVTPAEFELEALVRKANEGAEAQATLHTKYLDHGVEVNFQSDGYWMAIAKGDGKASIKYRIKPRPAFEEFGVGQQGSWRVRLQGTELHVGCKRFDARALKMVLHSMITHGGRDQAGNIYLVANRNGVRLHSSEYELSWADADRILEALKKAGF